MAFKCVYLNDDTYGDDNTKERNYDVKTIDFSDIVKSRTERDLDHARLRALGLWDQIGLNSYTGLTTSYTISRILTIFIVNTSQNTNKN